MKASQLVYKTCFIAFVFIGVSSCRGQVDDDPFLYNVKQVLSDSLRKWDEYPAPPMLTDEVVAGLKEELKDDTRRRIFFLFGNQDNRYVFEDTLKWLQGNHAVFSLLALSIHRNPDTRVMAVRQLWERIRMRPMVCTTKEGYRRLVTEDKLVLRFMVYLLENIPYSIAGSENATIHDIYMNYVLWNADLLSYEQRLVNQPIDQWRSDYKRAAEDLDRWKLKANE